MKQQSPNQNKIDTCGAPVYAPDYSATVVIAKMSTLCHEHSI